MGDDERLMRVALDACRIGVEAGGAPFGACVARDGRVVAATFNTCAADRDPTAHAEVNALRAAGRAVELDGATLYSSCEPCPMCYAAAVFAGNRADRVRGICRRRAGGGVHAPANADGRRRGG